MIKKYIYKFIYFIFNTLGEKNRNLVRLFY